MTRPLQRDKVSESLTLCGRLSEKRVDIKRFRKRVEFTEMTIRVGRLRSGRG
jgi:hypothetical protein